MTKRHRNQILKGRDIMIKGLTVEAAVSHSVNVEVAILLQLAGEMTWPC